MNRYDAEDMLKNYKWKIASVQLMRKELESAGGSVTAQYGLEAAQPKASGQTGDPIYKEAVRRESRWKKVLLYEKQIKEFQASFGNITDDREAEVLHWLLEGKSQRWIGNHMGLTAKHISRIKDSLINNIVSKESNVTNVTKDTLL